MARWHMIDEVYEEKTYMGVEESVFPATVTHSGDKFGQFYAWDGELCVPVDAGMVQPFGTPRWGIWLNKNILLFKAHYNGRLNPQVLERLDLEKEYAFFFEHSSAPPQTGYISRCRFVSVKQIKEWYQWGCVDSDRLTHGTSVAAVMAEFIDIEIRQSTRYEMEFDNLHFRSASDVYADGYGIGFGFWVEKPGVYRLWSRALWVPK